jgi:hypothetical protein
MWAYRKGFKARGGGRLLHVMRADVEGYMSTCGYFVTEPAKPGEGEGVRYCDECANLEGVKVEPA